MPDRAPYIPHYHVLFSTSRIGWDKISSNLRGQAAVKRSLPYDCIVSASYTANIRLRLNPSTYPSIARASLSASKYLRQSEGLSLSASSTSKKSHSSLKHLPTNHAPLLNCTGSTPSEAHRSVTRIICSGVRTTVARALGQHVSDHCITRTSSGCRQYAWLCGTSHILKMVARSLTMNAAISILSL